MSQTVIFILCRKSSPSSWGMLVTEALWGRHMLAHTHMHTHLGVHPGMFLLWHTSTQHIHTLGKGETP